MLEPAPRLLLFGAGPVGANRVLRRTGGPVSGSVSDGLATFRVTDNGRGIEARDHARVFELFRRSGAQDRPGEGIGLAHVRTIAGLKRRGVLIKNISGLHPLLARCVRVTIGTPEENTLLLSAFEAALKDTEL